MKFELSFLKDQLKGTGDQLKKGSVSSIFFSIVLLFLLSYLLYIPPQKSIEDPKLEVGDIITSDIVIKKDLTITDEDQTKINKNSVLNEIVPVYQFLPDDRENRNELINKWTEYIRIIRKQFLRNKNSLQKIKNSIEEKFGITLSEKDLSIFLRSNIHSKIDMKKFLNFLDNTISNGIVSSKAGIKKSINNTVKIRQISGTSHIQKTQNLIDINELEESMKNYFRNVQRFSDKESTLLSSILIDFVNVNLIFSPNLTKNEGDLALSRINPVIMKLKKGKVILRKGDEVKKEDLKVIKLIYKEEKDHSRKIPVFFLIFFTLGPILFFVIKLLITWESSDINGLKLISISLITLLLSAIVYRTFYFLLPIVLKEISPSLTVDSSIIYYSIPFAFGPLIIAFIFNIQSAVIFSFVNSIAGGILGEWDLTLSLYILIGNLIISFGIEYFQRLKRSSILKVSILWLFPANTLFLLLFNFTTTTSEPIQIIIFIEVAAFSAIIAPILASFVIPLWEMMFNLLTDLKLVELTNLNLPVFREMLEKAPGTYHHSQMVSSLSESAAHDLNLSPLLLNAMSLYHDIGKIDNPQVFTENHSIYENPHNDLTCRESAKNIISHIHNGMKRAKELKLSESISSAITQHHGTKILRFFYDKAISNSSGTNEEIDENLFKYPGDKPKNIENAIVMLADQVEAASKSLSSPNEEEIRNIIQQIINSNIEEKQFDECEGLTFKSLNTIADAFLKKLLSIYHMRISYPGFNFKEDSKNGNNS